METEIKKKEAEFVQMSVMLLIVQIAYKTKANNYIQRLKLSSSTAEANKTPQDQGTKSPVPPASPAPPVVVPPTTQAPQQAPQQPVNRPVAPQQPAQQQQVPIQQPTQQQQ